MEVTQEIVLPVLLAAIIANTVILLLVVVASRYGQRHRATNTRSALEGTVLSSSFVDREERSSWNANGGSADSTDAAETEVQLDTPYRQGADVIAALEAAVEEAAASEAAEHADGEPESAESVARGLETQETFDFDPLTGLVAPSAFTRLVAGEDARLQRYHHPATIVIVELGGLDRLIDRLGSEAADRVVPALADTMRRLARETDRVARLAPGRFGVLLPDTDEVAAINYVERVRRACELWLESGAIALRLAVGWAGTTGEPTLIDAHRIATDRMYVELRREARRPIAGSSAGSLGP